MPDLTPSPHISWSSDRTIRIVLGDRDNDNTHRRVVSVVDALHAANIPGVTDIAAGYTVVQAAWDSLADLGMPAEALSARVCACVHEALARIDASSAAEPGRVIEIPVCYGGEYGPDLAETAALRSLSPEQLIELHTSATYSVRFLGFSPGFAYLSGLPEKIHAPRLATPRARIAAGSVGIAGSQTGIYPQATPGGWRIIGRTTTRMFDPGRGEKEAALLRLGDRVRFVDWASCPSRGPSPGGLASTAITSGEAPELGQDAQATPELRIVHPGHFTTVQDLGRLGHAAMGVPRSGVADALSLRLGNRLVGNPDSAAALEMTLFGCTVECDAAVTIAITGSDAAATITRRGGSMVEVARQRPVTLNGGERLKIAGLRTGSRAYLCVSGGITAPQVLGSRSTHVASGIGGHDGRALRAGDAIPIARAYGSPATGPAVDAAARYVQEVVQRRVLTLTAGPRADVLSNGRAQLNDLQLTVTDRTDRSGVRLRANVAMGTPPGDLLTEPMLPSGGSVQLTPSGELIILGPDGPTTGGYAVVASVATVSLATLGQLRPGDTIACEVVTESRARACGHATRTVRCTASTRCSAGGIMSTTIDLNADVGEDLSPEGIARDAAIARQVTSLNIACGGHAGDDASMTRLVRLAHAHGLSIGAHPSYPDRANFGRNEMELGLPELEETLEEQVRSLAAVVERETHGAAQIAHIKPHGALYHAARWRDIAETIARACKHIAPHAILVGQSGSPALDVWRAMGCRVASEAFADRAYEPDGTLRNRTNPGAVLHDAAAVSRQAIAIAAEGRVTTSDGVARTLTADTLCLHSDTPGAAALAAAVRAGLVARGIGVTPLHQRR